MSNGGYESLKSKGIEIVKNNLLRNKIVYFYENRAGRYMSFIHENDNSIRENIDRLTTKIFQFEPTTRENGTITLGYRPIKEDPLNDQNLYQAIEIFNEDLRSKRYRIRSLKDEYLELNKTIETHLRERNISFIHFDSENVTSTF